MNQPTKCAMVKLWYIWRGYRFNNGNPDNIDNGYKSLWMDWWPSTLIVGKRAMCSSLQMYFLSPLMSARSVSCQPWVFIFSRISCRFSSRFCSCFASIWSNHDWFTESWKTGRWNPYFAGIQSGLTVPGGAPVEGYHLVPFQANWQFAMETSQI